MEKSDRNGNIPRLQTIKPLVRIRPDDVNAFTDPGDGYSGNGSTTSRFILDDRELRLLEEQD